MEATEVAAAIESEPAAEVISALETAIEEQGLTEFEVTSVEISAQCNPCKTKKFYIMYELQVVVPTSALPTSKKIKIWTN
eukprot:3731983-Amphidinium_carterae.2